MAKSELATIPAPQARLAHYDAVMRRLLVIRDDSRTSSRRAQRLFSTSMLISATRCLLTYIVLPILTPLFGVTAGVGPAVGIPLAVVALVFDVLGIRRFFAANHRLRWQITAVYLAVMGLVIALLVGNIETLVR